MKQTNNLPVSNRIYNYRIFKELELIVDVYHGNVSAEDICICEELKSLNKSWKSCYNVIHDFRSATLPCDEESIQDLADLPYLNPRLVGNRKVAYLIADNSAVRFKELLLSKAFDNLPIEVEEFWNIDEAIDWIGIDSGNTECILETINSLKEMSRNNFR